MVEKLISKVSVLRYDPSKDSRRYESYEVQYEKGARIIEILMALRDEIGRDIAYRSSCRTRLCGLCGALVNGKPTLTCWDEVLPMMTIEPLPHFPVIRDLVIDRSLYDERIQKVRPFLVPKDPISTRGPFTPETFSKTNPHDIKMAVEFQQCIECLLCVSTCPVSEGGRAMFAGPAALVRLAQYALDPRDSLPRVGIAYDEHVYDCTKCYSCEEVCPVGIPIVSGIVELEEAAKKKDGSERARRIREMIKGYL